MFDLKINKIHAIIIFIIIAAAGWFAAVNPVFFVEKNRNNVFAAKDNLVADVSYLTVINPTRDSSHAESLNRVADYIAAEFSKTGCVPEIQKFTVEKKEYKNIICSFGTENKSRVVVGAHYDAFIDSPGADDNASGVAGLLELARIIGRENPALSHRIDLVAYSLEEPPYFNTSSMGSHFHAKYLKDKGIKVAGMICLESIGYFSDEPGSQKYPLDAFRLAYPGKGDFIAVVGKFGQQGIVAKIKKSILENSDIKALSFNGPEILPGVSYSDHMNYWKFGYDAAMVTDTAFNRNPNYHEASDAIETLDFDRMAQVVRGVYFAAVDF
ncbi:MAG: M28 family peptidase [Candidatus Pacebacteria bacterium]|jgi:hypothetical protein|nr:M28 family peptidase [Candidatus Paceibacterota bacterium]